jgi:hypothetical protein
MQTVRYSVQGGSPRIDVVFEVDAEGSATVQVLTEASLPQERPVRLGTFAGDVPPGFVELLERWVPGVLDAARVAEQGPQPPPGPVTRFLSADGGEPLLVDPFTLPPGFEEGFAAAGAAALADPRSAVEVRADFDESRLAIRSIGSEGFPILLFAEDIAGYFARCWRDDPTATNGVVGLDQAAVRALVEAGEVPDGPAMLEPGRTIMLPLPPAPVGDAPMTGNFAFWRHGPGAERRIVAGTW